ncbi:MAG: hypothetical protein FIA89_13120 [Geobacter sp.]|nr:hypothetical protein [Geobacter sp.]
MNLLIPYFALLYNRCSKGIVMTHFRRSLFLLMIPFLLNGCAAYQNMNRRESCDKSIKDYTRLVRWQEAEKAAFAFVDVRQRPAYDKAVESLRRRNVTIADSRILAQQCLSEKRTAEATVEFDYFILPDNRLKTLTDRQVWVFRESTKEDPEQGDCWKLTSPLPDFK